MLLTPRGVGFVTVVDRWTGRETSLLRAALRLSVRDFAAHLGIGARTVNKWEARQADITPYPHMQEVLDTALARASDEVKARFAASRAQVAEREAGARSGWPVRGVLVPVVVDGQVVFVPVDADTAASGGLGALLDQLASSGGLDGSVVDAVVTGLTRARLATVVVALVSRSGLPWDSRGLLRGRK
ncbi:MAG: hypothetical protein LC799_00850 [Actinobacteria bacterium]|nr:hypothetical protein [Actinomycetota bacterium]